MIMTARKVVDRYIAVDIAGQLDHVNIITLIKVHNSKMRVENEILRTM